MVVYVSSGYLLITLELTARGYVDYSSLLSFCCFYFDFKVLDENPNRAKTQEPQDAKTEIQNITIRWGDLVASEIPIPCPKKLVGLAISGI